MATSSAEIERKYTVSADTVLPELSAAGLRAAPPRTFELVADYLDTSDLALLRNKLTLRRRTGGGDEGWHLKLPRAAGGRTEYHAALRVGDNDDPSAHVPADLLAVVAEVVAAAPLRQVARLATRRTEVDVIDDAGSVLAVVCDDQVVATSIDPADGTRDENRWREWEVELMAGDEAVLNRVEAQLLAAGARPATSVSKLAQALAPVLTRRRHLT